MCSCGAEMPVKILKLESRSRVFVGVVGVHILECTQGSLAEVSILLLEACPFVAVAAGCD